MTEKCRDIILASLLLLFLTVGNAFFVWDAINQHNIFIHLSKENKLLYCQEKHGPLVTTEANPQEFGAVGIVSFFVLRSNYTNPCHYTANPRFWGFPDPVSFDPKQKI